MVVEKIAPINEFILSCDKITTSDGFTGCRVKTNNQEINCMNEDTMYCCENFGTKIYSKTIKNVEVDIIGKKIKSVLYHYIVKEDINKKCEYCNCVNQCCNCECGINKV